MTAILYAIGMIDGWSSDSIPVGVGAGSYPVSEATTVSDIAFDTNTDIDLNSLFGSSNTMTFENSMVMGNYFVFPEDGAYILDINARSSFEEEDWLPSASITVQMSRDGGFSWGEDKSFTGTKTSAGSGWESLIKQKSYVEI